MAYSVEGQKVTLYLDCQKVATLDLPRGPKPRVSTDGVTVFGTRLLDEEVFEVRESERALITDGVRVHSTEEQRLNETTFMCQYFACKFTTLK